MSADSRHPLMFQAVAARFEAAEAKSGVRELSVRDTVRARIGDATFTIDYGRPLARGRVLLGNILPYDHVWRTGANAATQFTTSAPLTLAGMRVPAGSYTLWTVPRTKGADLIVNKETGQWGTDYDGSKDLGDGTHENRHSREPGREVHHSDRLDEQGSRDTHHGMGAVSVDGADRGAWRSPSLILSNDASRLVNAASCRADGHCPNPLPARAWWFIEITIY